jgi:hypothetical protein
VVVGTPIRSDNSQMDNNDGVTDEARVRSVAGIDFKPTGSALLT